MSNKRRRSVIILSSLASLVVIILLYVQFVEPIRLRHWVNNVVREYAVRKDIFTVDKIVSANDEVIFTDETVDAVYQLSKAEIDQLISDKLFMKCPPNKECSIETQTIESDGYYCTHIKEGLDLYISLCLNTSLNDNRALWTYDNT